MMKNNYFYSLFILAVGLGVLSAETSFGQAVSINATGTAPAAHSILDISSTTKGVLLPRMSTGEATTLGNSLSLSDDGMLIYDLTDKAYKYWNGVALAWREIPNTAGIVTTLDGSYDGGTAGSGNGRIILADAGAVDVRSGGGIIALTTDGNIQISEDDAWVGSSPTLQRLRFDDNSSGRIHVEDADLTIDGGRWIGIDGSSPRLTYTDGAPGILDVDEANVRVDDGTWFGLGSSIERFVFQGGDGEVNLMGAEFGIGTLAPTTSLDVNGQIRMRTGSTLGHVPVGDANGVMTWTDPALLGLDVTTASNGLTEVSDDIQLGGTLTQNTVVAQAGFTLDFTATAVNGFSVDGATLSVDATNNRIGIGTTTPDRDLHISGAAGGTMMFTRNDVSTDIGETLGDIQFDSEDNTGPSTGGSAIIRGIAAENHGNSNKGGHLAFLTQVAGWYNTPTEHMRITSGGNVAIGATTANVKFYVAGDATISGKFNSNGIQESSDERFKKNIQPIQGALKKVMQLEGVSYNWRVDEFPKRKFGERTEIGVIAQDLEKVYPELVSTDQDGYKSVQYSHLVPVLIEAIKEQQKQIEGLKKQAENNESKYGDLKRYLGEIENGNK
jgi:hypothetical protein